MTSPDGLIIDRPPPDILHSAFLRDFTATPAK